MATIISDAYTTMVTAILCHTVNVYIDGHTDGYSDGHAVDYAILCIPTGLRHTNAILLNKLYFDSLIFT